MYAKDISEYLQSEKYEKRKSKFQTELNAALVNIRNTDEAMRLKGAKRLSYNSRRELGVCSLGIREWFWNEDIRNELTSICLEECDAKVLYYLLSALKFLYSRYLSHHMWDDFEGLRTKEDELIYIQWVLHIVEKCQPLSLDVKVEMAGIFAICRDKRAWDVYSQSTLETSKFSILCKLMIFATLTIFAFGENAPVGRAAIHASAIGQSPIIGLRS